MYGPTDGQATAFAVFFIAGVVFIPLGVWKAVELVIWVFTHIRWYYV